MPPWYSGVRQECQHLLQFTYNLAGVLPVSYCNPATFRFRYDCCFFVYTMADKPPKDRGVNQ